MRVTARLDGQGLKVAQFTRVARRAVVLAEPRAHFGGIQWQVHVQDAPGRVSGLLDVLRAGGCTVQGSCDPDAGRFEGTCTFPLSIVDGRILAAIDALRRATLRLALTFHGGSMHVEADADPQQLATVRSLLQEIDPSWDGQLDPALAPARNA